MGLKVLMVIPFFLPIVKGSSLYVYHLSKGLAALGVHVGVHTHEIRKKDQENLPDFDLSDIDVMSFKCLFDPTGSIYDQPLSLSYITSIIKNCDDFDMIHVHEFPRICNDLLVLATKKLKARSPLIITPHGSGLAWGSRKLSHKIYWSLGIPQKVLRIADQIIAVSSLQARLFAGVCDINKVSMIPEAVPPYYFVDEPSFVDDGKLKVLFIGRIAEEKGIKDLLYAMHEITKMADNESMVELVCVGPNYGYLEEAVRIINDLRLKNVKMLGPLPECEKIKCLKWCDILVLPSYSEAFGLTLLEAMAQGKPVVATKTVGAMSLVRHLETGFLVRIGDPESIARALMRFLQDSNLKYQMGRRALEHASEFNMKNMIQSHISLYERVLSNQ